MMCLCVCEAALNITSINFNEMFSNPTTTLKSSVISNVLNRIRFTWWLKCMQYTVCMLALRKFLVTLPMHFYTFKSVVLNNNMPHVYSSIDGERKRAREKNDNFIIIKMFLKCCCFFPSASFLTFFVLTFSYSAV